MPLFLLQISWAVSGEAFSGATRCFEYFPLKEKKKKEKESSNSTKNRKHMAQGSVSDLSTPVPIMIPAADINSTAAEAL